MGEKKTGVRIVETEIEGQPEEQRGRGAFEDWVLPEPRYWRAIHVAAEDTIPVVNRHGEPVAEVAENGAKAFHIVSGPTTGAISIRNAFWEYPVGASSNIQWHNAEECYYVVQGKGYVEIEGERHDFEARDGVFIPLRTKHRIVNDGDVPLQLVQVASLMLRACDDLATSTLDYREYTEVQ